MQSEWMFFLSIFSSILLAVSAITVILAILCYVFQAIGLYRIAKRRGIPHAWFAWLPFLGDWLLGSISDQFRYVVKNKITHRRVILLILAIVVGVGGGVTLPTALNLLGNAFYQAYQGYDEGFGMVFPLITLSGLSSLLSVLSLVVLVFRCMALYDLYSSCNPANNVLFLVLGIIFPVTVPFFLFSCRNLDIGMPPRRY